MTEWRIQQHDIVVTVPNTEENNIPLHKRTRTGSSSSTSSSSFSFFGMVILSKNMIIDPQVQ